MRRYTYVVKRKKQIFNLTLKTEQIFTNLEEKKLVAFKDSSIKNYLKIIINTVIVLSKK